jgi:6-phospho-3-hexuloisomerase
MRHILEELQTFADQIDPRQVSNFQEAIVQAHGQKLTIVGVAAGRMGYALRAFIMRLGHVGLPAHMIGDTCVPRLRDGDLVIFNSSSGETPSLVTLAKQAKLSGACLIYCGCEADSSIGRLASKHLIYPKLISTQPMKSLYEQGSMLLFDSMAQQIAETLKVDMSANHSILE